MKPYSEGDFTYFAKALLLMIDWHLNDQEFTAG